jgi:predicted nucleic acid-binding protein
VVDTNVLVGALLSASGHNRDVLRACFEGRVQPIIGEALFLEYEDIRKRLTKCRVDGLLELWWLKRRSGSESGSSPCCGRIFADTLKRKVGQTG